MSKLHCPPEEVALKSFFLGPQAENAEWLEKSISQVLKHWFEWRRHLFPDDGRAISETDQSSKEFLLRQKLIDETLRQLALRFEKEMPKFSPRYIGHMLSETSLPALLGHIVTLLHNPNNISGDASRVGVEIEREAIEALKKMMGYPDFSRGHFTSGGTIANFEALHRARLRMYRWLAKGAALKSEGNWDLDLFHTAHQGWEKYESQKLEDIRLEDLNPLQSAYFPTIKRIEKIFDSDFEGPVVLIPQNRHYSWEKGVSLMGLSQEALWDVALDEKGRLSVPDLEKKIEQARQQRRPILMVVSVAGTTELGTLDPVDRVQELLGRWQAKENLDIWHHVDAAYGGFFCSVPKASQVLAPTTIKALGSIRLANSVSLDPHKLGYVPYSSGTFLVRNPAEYGLIKVNAPYINFDLAKDHGPQTLEGSRSAAGAVATWMTLKCVGFGPEGYGRILERTVKGADNLKKHLEEFLPQIAVAPFQETNVLCFCAAVPGDKVSETNQRTKFLYDKLSPQTDGPFIVSKTELSWANYESYLDGYISQWKGKKDEEKLFLIRLCLMNPFFDSKETKVNYIQELTQTLETYLEKFSTK